MERQTGEQSEDSNGAADDRPLQGEYVNALEEPRKQLII
jgi:hypothetical protein